MKISRGVLCLSSLLITLLATGTNALAWSSGARTHDNIFFRACGGIGYATVSASYEGASATAYGAGGLFDFAIGGVLANRVALHVNFAERVIFGSSLEFEAPGMTIESEADVRSGFAALGFGLTAFLSNNFYLSPSLGMGWLVLTEDGEDIPDTGTGFLTRMLIGKEWWITDASAAGLALAFDYSTNSDNIVDTSWHGIGFALVLSVTCD